MKSKKGKFRKRAPPARGYPAAGPLGRLAKVPGSGADSRNTKKPHHYVGEASQNSGLEKEDVGKGSTRMG